MSEWAEFRFSPFAVAGTVGRVGYRASVITCSDRAAADVYEDRSGPVLWDALSSLGFEVSGPVIVPDEFVEIRSAVEGELAAGARVVITTGGTGVGPRDVTVDATRSLLAFEVRGLMEEVRRVGAQNEPRALLSRGVAGVVDGGDKRGILVNAPGSRGGARDTISVVGPLLGHLVDQLDGTDHC